MKSEPGAIGDRVHSRMHNCPTRVRIYIEGDQPGVRVPFREIRSETRLAISKTSWKTIRRSASNDTSGPYGDLAWTTDVREGLQPVRRDWIIDRGDVEEYEGRDIQPIDDGLSHVRRSQPGAHQREKGVWKIFPRCAARHCAPGKGQCVPQMHYAGAASSRLKWEFIAIRENLGTTMSDQT